MPVPSPVFVSALRAQRFITEYREGFPPVGIAMSSGVHPEVPRVITEAADEYCDFEEQLIADGGVTVLFEEFSSQYGPIAKRIALSRSLTPQPPTMSM